MRALGFSIFFAWTALAILIGYWIKSPEKIVDRPPIVIENVCPPPRTIVLAPPVYGDSEPPIVIHIEEPKTEQPKPTPQTEVATTKKNLELMLGFQSTPIGGSAEAILKMPVKDQVGMYVGYTSRSDFSVGVSYQF